MEKRWNQLSGISLVLKPTTYFPSRENAMHVCPCWWAELLIAFEELAIVAGQGSRTTLS
jgi:hypothetical protein